MKDATHLRILHTSDCHLDADLPHRDNRHITSRNFAAFRRVIDKTLELDIDLLIVAGDFFDSNRASRTSIDFATSELARTKSQVVVLPGNHDSIDSGSVYHRADLSLAGPHVHTLTRRGGHELTIPEIRTRVWGQPGTEIEADFRPLKGLPPRDGDYWHVAVAHGHVMDAGSVDRWGPISKYELLSGDWDYLALGHWDHLVDVTEGNMRAVYSGSPVPSRDSNVAGCVLVSLAASGNATVEVIALLEQPD